MALAQGIRLGPYEILSPLGAGGMGEVYRAKDTRLDRTVALKVLPEDFFECEERRQRFEREARLLASLNHPGIAVLYSFEEIPSSSPSSVSRHILAMELLDGETLRTALMRGALPLKKALDIAAQVADALGSAHENGIIHRDVKPENVFICQRDERDYVKVVDFGISKSLKPNEQEPESGRLTQTGMVLGTPLYMSPEQARAQPADERSDVYSLCVLLHELLGLRHYLAHKQSWAEVIAGVLTEEATAASLGRCPHQRTVPADLVWFVKQGMQKRPEDRYPSVGAMIQRLALRRAGIIPIQCPVTFLKRVSTAGVHFAERHPALAMAGLAVTLGVLVWLGVRGLG